MILRAVRWYLMFPISYRDLALMLHDRGVAVDHTTTSATIQAYAAELEKRIRQPFRLRVAGFAERLPPPADRLHSEGGGIMVDAEAHPSGIGGNVVDAIRDRLAEFGDLEVMHRTGSGSPFGRHSRPPFLQSPTSSFFLVSTEIVGCPSA